MTEENTPVADLTQVIPANFGGLPAKYQHALRCNDAEEWCRFVKEAAAADYIPAMCDYGRMCQDDSEGKRWLPVAGPTIPCSGRAAGGPPLKVGIGCHQDRCLFFEAK